MVVQCCAYGCTETMNKKAGISLHQFPKDPIRKKMWLLNVRRKDFEPSHTSKICSRHFEEECFDREKFGGTWLKTTAVPTIFDFPPHVQVPRLKRVDDNHESVASTSSKPVEDTNVNGLFYLCDAKDLASYSPTELETASTYTEKRKEKIFYPQKIDRGKKRKRADLCVIFKELEEKELISAEAKEALETSGVTDEILKGRSKSRKDKYPSELRFFALTLYNYSPEGYNYVRNVFDTCLPQRSTLRRWYEAVITSIFEGAPVPEAKIIETKTLNHTLPTS